jgi:hypothetical protein
MLADTLAGYRAHVRTPSHIRWQTRAHSTALLLLCRADCSLKPSVARPEGTVLCDQEPGDIMWVSRAREQSTLARSHA